MTTRNNETLMMESALALILAEKRLQEMEDSLNAARLLTSYLINKLGGRVTISRTEIEAFLASGLSAGIHANPNEETVDYVIEQRGEPLCKCDKCLAQFEAGQNPIKH